MKKKRKKKHGPEPLGLAPGITVRLYKADYTKLNKLREVNRAVFIRDLVHAELLR